MEHTDPSSCPGRWESVSFKPVLRNIHGCKSSRQTADLPKQNSRHLPRFSSLAHPDALGVVAVPAWDRFSLSRCCPCVLRGGETFGVNFTFLFQTSEVRHGPLATPAGGPPSVPVPACIPWERGLGGERSFLSGGAFPAGGI